MKQTVRMGAALLGISCLSLASQAAQAQDERHCNSQLSAPTMGGDDFVETQIRISDCSETPSRIFVRMHLEGQSDSGEVKEIWSAMHEVRDSGDTGDLGLRSNNHSCARWPSMRQRTEVYVTWQDGTTSYDEPASDWRDLCSEEEPPPPPDDPEPEPEPQPQNPPPPSGGIAWLVDLQCSDGFNWYPATVRYCASATARPDVLALQTNGCADLACRSEGMVLTGVDVPIADQSTSCPVLNECGW